MTKSHILKIIEKILQEPAEMRFKDVEKIVLYFGYELINVKGSHFAYYSEMTGKTIILVKHHNMVKGRGYFKKIKQILNLEEWYEQNKKSK